MASQKNLVSPEGFQTDERHSKGKINGFSKTMEKQSNCFLCVFASFIIALLFIITIIVGLTLSYIKSVDLTGRSNQNPIDSPSTPVPTTIQPLPQWPPPSGSFLGKYKHVAVATDNGDCSVIAKNVLVRGGNAVDAAIAATICIGVVSAHSSGLGGGHFLNFYDSSSGKCTIIDSREVAPKKATKDMYNHTSSTQGWKAIGVPGELYGLWTAYDKYGSHTTSNSGITWKSLLMPTVNMLRYGFPVSSSMAHAIQVKANTMKKIQSVFYQMLINPKTNKLYVAGDIMTRPRFANTLEELADSSNPVSLFYNGKIANQVVKEFEANGAIITAEDLSQYKSIIRREVITTQLPNGLHICGPPPPSSSAITQAIINIMSGYKFSPQKNLTTFDGNVMTYHRLLETMKFAYADRSKLGDLDFVPSALPLARNITTQEYAEFVRTKITNRAHNTSYYGGTFEQLDDHGTSHIAVMDQDGNAVSLTSTINTYFGSLTMSPSTGIIWNDEMDDFSTPGKDNTFGYPPSPNNYILPGKRPMSSMSPIVLFNTTTNKAQMVVGAAGGSKIISSTAYVAVRVLLFDENIKQAMDAPRLHNQLLPSVTRTETGFPEPYAKALRSLGQIMNYTTSHIAVVNGIHRGNDGFIYANSDFRKGRESRPAGY